MIAQFQQGRFFFLGDVLTLVLAEPVKEHQTVLRPVGHDRPISATLAATNRPNPLLDEEAAEPRLNQSVLDLGSCFTELLIGQAYVAGPTMKLDVHK